MKNSQNPDRPRRRRFPAPPPAWADKTLAQYEAMAIAHRLADDDDAVLLAVAAYRNASLADTAALPVQDILALAAAAARLMQTPITAPPTHVIQLPDATYAAPDPNPARWDWAYWQICHRHVIRTGLLQQALALEPGATADLLAHILLPQPVRYHHDHVPPHAPRARALAHAPAPLAVGAVRWFAAALSDLVATYKGAFSPPTDTAPAAKLWQEHYARVGLVGMAHDMGYAVEQPAELARFFAAHTGPMLAKIAMLNDRAKTERAAAALAARK